ncbi:Ribokinase-like protein [Nemania serpens]|nr:Ribokinase-like protein [Nemania serpens]
MSQCYNSSPWWMDRSHWLFFISQSVCIFCSRSRARLGISSPTPRRERILLTWGRRHPGLRQPGAPAEVRAEGERRDPGRGEAHPANTARGAQYLLPANSVVYLGGVGDDKYAAILRDAVKQVGLRVEYRVDPKTPTGRCGVVITDDNRSLCTDLAAANLYDVDHLRSPEIWALAENADFYYVGGYHFTDTLSPNKPTNPLLNQPPESA